MVVNWTTLTYEIINKNTHPNMPIAFALLIVMHQSLSHQMTVCDQVWAKSNQRIKETNKKILEEDSISFMELIGVV